MRCASHEGQPAGYCDRCITEALNDAFATAYLRLMRKLDPTDEDALIIYDVCEQGKRGA